MSLEQRVEVLEQVVKAFMGGAITIEKGQVFIKEAFLQGGSITAARTEAAEIRNAKISGDLNSSGKP